MDKLTLRAEIIIRKLTEAGVLPKASDETTYLRVWEAIKEGLKESDRKAGVSES